MLAGGPFGLGLPELLVILVVLVLVFGVNKVGDIGGALGKSVREFRKAASDGDAPKPTSTNNSSNNASADASQAATSAPQPATERFCTNCGSQLNAEAKFCAQCGTPTQAIVS